MLIYANKQDLISALSAEEIEELLCLGMINDRAWTIVACSAKEKEGMDCYSTLMKNRECVKGINIRVLPMKDHFLSLELL